MAKHDFFTTGAYKIADRFPLLQTPTVVAKQLTSESWTPVSKTFKSYEKTWQGIYFIAHGEETEFMEEFPEMREVAEFFPTYINAMMLYTTKPGAKLHPHIDMSGNLPNGCLRFHIPIITNDKVFFLLGRRFNRQQVRMLAGEFWALDTSHMHSVENASDLDRIHLVVEVKANDWVWSQLPPRTFGYWLHYLAFWGFDVPLALLRRFLVRFKLLPPAKY